MQKKDEKKEDMPKQTPDNTPPSASQSDKQDGKTDKKEKEKIGDIDIKKARDIVLDTIGKEEKQKREEKTEEQSSKGPTPLFFKHKKFDRTGVDEKAIAKKAEGIKEIREISAEDKKAEKSPTPLFFKKKEPIKPKPIIKKPKIEEETSLKQEKVKTKKIEKVVKAKEIKKAIKPKIVKTEKNLSQKKISRLKDIKIIPKEKLLPSSEFIKSVINYLIYIFVISILLFIIVYSFFIILVIQFDIDNIITRKISKYLPVPALVTKYGIIEYYEYKDALSQNTNNLQTIRFELIKGLINNGDDVNKVKVWKLVE